MTTRLKMVFAGLAIVLLLAACQPASAATQAPVANTGGGSFQSGSGNGNFGGGFNGSGGATLSPDQRATRIAARQPAAANGGGFTGFGQRSATPTPQPTDTPAPTPTVVTDSELASGAAQKYFGFLQAGDFTSAAGMTSNLSRFAFKLSTAGIASTLTAEQQAGAAWSNFQVVGTQQFNATTTLVHVTYDLATKDAKTGQSTQAAKDELWPIVLENGSWLYNWNNIIDFNTLTTVPYQAANGLTVTLLQLTRYTDHMTLTLMAQNNSNDAIAIGTPSEILATFHFGSQSVDAANTQYVIDRMRGYSNIDVTVPGLFTSYPTSVELIKYKNYPTEKPWFTFNVGN